MGCQPDDGEPLTEFATVKGDPQHYLTRLVEFVRSQNIALEYDSAIAPARGMSSAGKITLLPDLSPAEHLATLAHESAHELLHRGERRKETTHIVRETEAEAVAFVVCSAIGLDVNSASADYVLLHGGDKATLTESLALIQQPLPSSSRQSSLGRLQRQTPFSVGSARPRQWRLRD